MNKKIIFLSLFLGVIIFITYRNDIAAKHITPTSSSPIFTEIFDLLMDNKIDEAKKIIETMKNLQNMRGQFGETLLHRAAQTSPELIEIILTKNIDVNDQDTNKKTPLMYAIGAHNVAAVKKLLALGADPSITDNSKQTALETTNHYINRLNMIGGMGLGTYKSDQSPNFKKDLEIIKEILQQYQK